ncbi:MAG TPA: D-alanyl-D-alanine carboxypeptidase family protein [Oscillospiraceae bacterium]|nr:D-alanyl-D-alanine carboxypeptidase family protein [Oscillospiraceae bacterium]
MRNKLLLVVLVITLVLASALPALAIEFEFQSSAQLLLDMASGQVLYENNAHEKLYPASVTKVMTMLLAMEALESGKVTLTEMIPISERAAAHGGSQIFLSPGDRVSFEDLMIGIVVGSANDGAWAMAEFLAGSADVFVEQMNARAKELGMKNTHFVNPHGLHDDNHYTTAFDIALMSLELSQYPKIHEWATIWMDEDFLKGKIKKEEGVYLSNSNNLVRYYDGCDGLKTGFTDEAGNCIAATAGREQTRLLAVIMKAAGRPVLFEEARELLNWGFANYQSVPIVKGGEILATAAVDKGQSTTVDIVAAADLALLLPKGSAADYEQELELPKRLPAPLTPKSAVGRLIVKSADGEELGSISLVPKEEVPRAKLTTFLTRYINHWAQFDRK